MSNGYNIEWSELAVKDLNDTIQYLSENWGEDVIRRFVRILNSQIETIRFNPFLYPSTLYRPGLRRCVASKHHTIYYLIKDQTIYIVTLWDNRRDSRKLEDVLK